MHSNPKKKDHALSQHCCTFIVFQNKVQHIYRAYRQYCQMLNMWVDTSRALTLWHIFYRKYPLIIKCSVASVRLQACHKINLIVIKCACYPELHQERLTLVPRWKKCSPNILWKIFVHHENVLTQCDSCCSVPVCRLGGDERAQRCERRVDRIGAISLPCVGCGPLATLHRDRGPLGDEPPHHAPYIYPSAPSCPAQLPLPVHLDVKSRWRRGGQAEVRGVGVTLLRAWPLAPVLIIIFRKEGDIAVQEAACWRRRAQHSKCHLHCNNALSAAGQSTWGFHLLRFNFCKFVEANFLLMSAPTP